MTLPQCHPEAGQRIPPKKDSFWKRTRGHQTLPVLFRLNRLFHSLPLGRNSFFLAERVERKEQILTT